MKCATPLLLAPSCPRWCGKSQMIVLPSGTIFYSCVSHKIVQLVTKMSSPASALHLPSEVPSILEPHWGPRVAHMLQGHVGGWWQARFRFLFWHILMADVVRIVDFVDSISR